MNSLTSRLSKLLKPHPTTSTSSSSSSSSLFLLTSPSFSKPHTHTHTHTHHHYRCYSSLLHQKVSVWWDIDDCPLPTCLNVLIAAHSITDAVRANGIKGPLQISTFGHISKPHQQALSSAGVNVVHIPNGGTESVHQSLIVSLNHWVSQNSPPAHIFLISGNKNYADILHNLRRRRYNILLAAREGKQIPVCLSSAATIMWHWNELVKGENLLGMHFNQPPEKEHPFTESERQNEKSPRIDDSSNAAEQSLDYEHRRVPGPVLYQLNCIIDQYPEGVSITEFQNQLEMSNVAVDYKAFYGYGTLSRFLLALPHIVELESRPDGEIFVHRASAKVSVLYVTLGYDYETAPSISGTLPRTTWVDNGTLRITRSPSPSVLEYSNRGCYSSDDDDDDDDDNFEEDADAVEEVELMAEDLGARNLD